LDGLLFLSGQTCCQAVGRIASPNASGLAVQVSHWVFVASAAVRLSMVVEFLFEYMRDLRVDEDLQR
jgi:hypothetical protein